MHISDDLMEHAMEVCLWALPVVIAAAAAWAIFFPPRRVRRWPEGTRLLLGVLAGAMAANLLRLAVVRPLINAQYSAHNGMILLDYPVDMIPAVFLWLAAVVISCFLFLIRVCARRYL